MGEQRLSRVLTLASLAPAGVFTGHCLSYLVAIPDQHARHAVMVAGGHGWWSLAVPAAAALAAASAAQILVRHTRRGVTKRERGELCAWLAPRLAVTQLVSFGALEFAERLVTGQPLAAATSHAVLLGGILTQPTVALAVTVLLWLLASAGARLRVAGPSPWVPIDLAAVLQVAPQGPQPSRSPIRSRSARAPPA